MVLTQLIINPVIKVVCGQFAGEEIINNSPFRSEKVHILYIWQHPKQYFKMFMLESLLVAGFFVLKSIVLSIYVPFAFFNINS